MEGFFVALSNGMMIILNIKFKTMVCMLIILRNQHADPQKVKNQKLGCPGEAKTQAVVPAARGAVVAISRPAAPRAAVPAAAALHPVRATGRTLRICNMASRIISIPVSSHHSQTLPWMSYKPHELGFFCATG